MLEVPMNPGKTLFKLAYAFKQSKIWKMIYEDELFAVDLDGEIGYCSLMGRNGQHIALAVYVGTEGFSTLRYMQKIDQSNLADLLSQDCIQCSLEKKEEFMPEELDTIQAYCKENGIAFRTPYPQFSRYYPYCVPCAITNSADKKHLREALKVVVALAEILQRYNKSDLHLRGIAFDTEGETYVGTWGPAGPLMPNPAVTIPLFRLERGKLMCTDIPLPPYVERRPSTPTRINEIDLARLMKLPKKGIYQCQIVRAPEPVEGNPPYLPALVMTVDEETGMVLPPATAEGALYNADALLDEFISILVEQTAYPACIYAQTEETLAFLKGFCEKARIKLEKVEELPELEESVDALYEQYQQDDRPDMNEIFDRISQMSLDELAGLPPMLLSQLHMMDTTGILPDALSNKLRKLRE